jgi:preprotein translocase subunit SecE
MAQNEASGTGSSAIEGATGQFRRFRDFLKDVRTEMKHVSYPSTKEVRGTTVVVIITVALFGIFFYLVDLIFSRAIDWIFHRFA